MTKLEKQLKLMEDALLIHRLVKGGPSELISDVEYFRHKVQAEKESKERRLEKERRKLRNKDRRNRR